MDLYKLFSCNVQVQYKGCLLSKAMLFTLLTTMLTIILPFLIAHRSRGFWLKSHNFYEKPLVEFNFDYLLVLETDDPSHPVVCGDIVEDDEHCAEFLVLDNGSPGFDGNPVLDFSFEIMVPYDRTVTSVFIIFGLDYQLKTVCPLHMQSVAIISKEFAAPASIYKYYGDLQLYQTSHLPCIRNAIDTRFNNSIIALDEAKNLVDSILENNIYREVTTPVKEIYSRTQIGHTGKMDLEIHLRIPEVKVRYTPSLMQELKWAWPQYLSLLLIFYWVFNRVKEFVFNNRLLMAWKIIPWKRHSP